MLDKVLYFIKYNNAVTIIVVMCFSGFGVAYAASPAVRDSVYSSQEVVVSVDNRAIVAANLDAFDFSLKINSVTEDDKNYYVAYSYQTLAIGNSVWQNTTIEKTLAVNKEALDGKDLGLYAAKELGDNIDYELSYLKRVQKIEQERGASQKVVTTEYSGLVGKLLNPKENVIEGYNPVVPPEVAPEVPTVETPPQEPAIVPPVNSEPQISPAPESIVPQQTEPAPESTSTATTTPASSGSEPEQTATSTPASEPAPESTSIATTTEASEPATSTPDITP